MEAPKKIYMPNELLSEEWTRHIEGEDVEYTRTDAFIEKAISYIQQHWIWNTKMIEDFKNHMKGE